MTKNSLLYSRSFQATFGEFKSLAYIDKLFDSGEVTIEQKKYLHKIFTKTCLLCRKSSNISDVKFREFVIFTLKNHLISNLDTNKINGVILSLTKNFIISKSKIIVRHI